jgi:shikimate kinase
MIILVIGPSGVGKSASGESAAQEIPSCQFFDVDAIVSKKSGMPASQLLGQKGPDAFFSVCRHEIEKIAQSSGGRTAIMAVGAGALVSHLARGFLSCFSTRTIALVAAADEVYKRGGQRNQARTLQQFKDTEYSPYRLDLYRNAKYQCDVTGLSLDKTKARFIGLIKAILQVGPGGKI